MTISLMFKTIAIDKQRYYIYEYLDFLFFILIP